MNPWATVAKNCLLYGLILYLISRNGKATRTQVILACYEGRVNIHQCLKLFTNTVATTASLARPDPTDRKSLWKKCVSDQ